MQIDLTAARKDLSRLAQGDEIVELTLRGKTVAVLYPLKLVPSLGANPETQRRQAPASKASSRAKYDSPAVTDLLRKAFPTKGRG